MIFEFDLSQEPFTIIDFESVNYVIRPETEAFTNLSKHNVKNKASFCTGANIETKFNTT